MVLARRGKARLALMTHQDRLRITPAVTGDAVWLRITGDLDLGTASDLSMALGDAERGNPMIVGLELSRVEFADVAALRLFVAAARRARLKGRRFVLAYPSRTVSRMLAVTSLDRTFDVRA